MTKITLNGKHINLGNFDDVKNSNTLKEEEIFINFNLEDTIKAKFQFAQNENDEMGALVTNLEIDFNEEDKKEIEKIQNVISEFLNNVKEQFGESDDSEFPVDFKQIAFNHFISRIHYISADRLGPIKYVDKVSFDDIDFITVGPRGERSFNILAKNNLPLVNDKLYLGNDSKSIIQQTEEWLGYILEGAKIEIKGKENTSSVLWMQINNKTNSYKYKPTNVGFGYSYILPLIVSGLIAQPGDILIVENPEAHLHPRAQSRIAEFFTRIASCDVQVFIESHSEHILNGLRVSALKPEIEIKYNELSIHYFNESFDSIKLEMDEKGKIANWPTGFFDQQENDLAEIFKYNRPS